MTGEIPEGTVTVLFTDLVDSTRLNQRLGDDGSRDASRQVEVMARDLVETHRGILIKEMGDGLMAAFASARRAVTCAKEIQLEMRRLQRGGLGDIEMRIGLHTGEVIAEDGDIHGETVIIAKRIEGLAPPGSVLASDTVYGVLGTARDELIDHGTAELKGIDMAWQLYLVPVPDDEEDESPDTSELTPYIGRTSERDRLNSAVEAAVGGHGRLVLLGGAAGLGKSRLAKEVGLVADQRGMVRLVGHCVDMEHPPPYKPIIDQLEWAMRLSTPEAMREALGENAPEVAKLMPSLRQRYEDIADAPDLNPEQERQYMLHGVAEFIERSSHNQPLMLVFEDIHWADESTLLLIRQLAIRLEHAPLLIIGTYRSNELLPDRPLTTALPPLVRDHGAIDMQLDLFDRAEITSLLRSRSDKEPPKQLVDLVEYETQGNPFFVEEVYRHLLDTGRLFDADGDWCTSFEIADTEVPQSVRFVIGQRLDRLDVEHRRLMATAAVIGRRFAFDVLLDASRADEDDLFDALEAATAIHIIEESSSSQQAVYTFVHEQIRQTLLGELALPRRQRLHVRVADALESQTGTRPVFEIAHHLLSAGPAADSNQAAAALIDAADLSVKTLAFEDGLAHLANAQQTLNHLTDRVALLRGKALRGTGRVDDAIEVLVDALEDEHIQDRSQIQMYKVRLLLEQFRATETFEDIDKIIELARVDHDDDLEMSALLARGRAHYIMSLDNAENAIQARHAYEAAYEFAKLRDDKRSMALALIPTSWFTDYWVEYRDTAIANIAEALELAKEVDDADLILDAESASLHRGGARRSLEGGIEHMARLEARRDPVRLNAHCFWMMWTYQSSGHFQDSIDTCDRGIELAAQIGTRPVQYGSIKAISLTALGHYDEVDHALSQEVTDDAHPFGQLVAAHARTVFLDRIEAWEPAAESALLTYESAVELSRMWTQMWTLRIAAALEIRLESDARYQTLWDAVAANESQIPVTGRALRLSLSGRHLEALEVVLGGEILDRRGHQIGETEVNNLEIAGRSHVGLGAFDKAAPLLTSALEASERMDYASVTWRVRRQLADVMDELGEGQEAAIHRSRAQKEFMTLAARIADPELRGWFERQPLAPHL